MCVFDDCRWGGAATSPLAIENTYPDGALYVRADCPHEWSGSASAVITDEPAGSVTDTNRSALSGGAPVLLIKDLRVQ